MAQSANVSPTKGFAAWQALTKALFDDYRPELHYMRGPGPAWHAKHDIKWQGERFRSFRGTREAREPGIQKRTPCLRLDSGFARCARAPE